jgi:cyanophycinase
MKLQGKLIIIGGAVDKGSFTETDLDKNAAKNLNFFEEGILKRVINESKHKELSRIEIITTASKIPLEIGPEYVKALEDSKDAADLPDVSGDSTIPIKQIT